MSKRAQRAAAVEAWADTVDPNELVEVDRSALRTIAELAAQRDGIDLALADAVRAARREGRSWSEVGAMLGVTKQAAQRKYGSPTAA